jgi:hypothetical protein
MFVRIRSGTPPRLTMGEPGSSSRGYVQEWLRGKRWGNRASRLYGCVPAFSVACPLRLPVCFRQRAVQYSLHGFLSPRSKRAANLHDEK